MPLAVSGAFHSPFMSDAARTLEAEFAGLAFREPAIPVYANRTAKVKHPVPATVPET